MAPALDIQVEYQRMRASAQRGEMDLALGLDIPRGTLLGEVVPAMYLESCMSSIQNEPPRPTPFLDFSSDVEPRCVNRTVTKRME